MVHVNVPGMWWTMMFLSGIQMYKVHNAKISENKSFLKDDVQDWHAKL